MNKKTDEKVHEGEVVPSSWAALARESGISQQTMSMTLRNVLAAKGETLPGRVPRPPEMPLEIVQEVIRVVRTTYVHRRSKGHASGVETRAEQEQRIRDQLDEVETSRQLLGQGLLETVAEEMKLPLELIEKVVKQRLRARKLEQEVLKFERQREIDDLRYKQAKRAMTADEQEALRESKLAK